MQWSPANRNGDLQPVVVNGLRVARTQRRPGALGRKSITLRPGSRPGMEAITAQAEGFFVGLSYAESALYLGLVTPSEESWSQGDRSILCTIYDPAGQVSSSLRNVERWANVLA